MTKTEKTKERMEMYRLAYSTAMFNKETSPDAVASLALNEFDAKFKQDV